MKVRHQFLDLKVQLKFVNVVRASDNKSKLTKVRDQL